MECRKFEITLISANDLPDVRTFLLLKVYAEVSISIMGEYSKTTKKTPVDIEGEANPKWNFSMQYTVGEEAVQQEAPRVILSIKLYCQRTLGADRFIGEVIIPLKKLFDDGLSAENVRFAVDGTPRGRLNISYKFGEKILVKKRSSSKGNKALAVGLLILGAFLLLKGKEDQDREIPIFADDKDVVLLKNDSNNPCFALMIKICLILLVFLVSLVVMVMYVPSYLITM